MQIKIAMLIASAVVALALAPASAVAVDSGPEPVASDDHEAGRRAIAEKDWNSAIRSLSAAAQRESRNADIQNLLGYAYRNAGQLESAFRHYQRALQIDPRHRGAHEYIGEAYLMSNNPAKAEEHLAALRSMCPRICEEYDDLKKQIDQYRARGK